MHPQPQNSPRLIIHLPRRTVPKYSPGLIIHPPRRAVFDDLSSELVAEMDEYSPKLPEGVAVHVRRLIEYNVRLFRLAPQGPFLLV
eukprot:scaffold34341_cov107-Isochrysis_galbana.AAC.1